ncbi:MAG: RtcB family protein [Lentisphaerae bacterium]|nr:RtcB family protein [Lentisphaerota bacterium]
MDTSQLQQQDETRWMLPPAGRMRAPAILYASSELIRAMDNKVLEQLTNIAALPGIETAALAMPDAHWGYGFPIGGVAAFDADSGGVVSAGGVGFDISCGVRTILTGLLAEEVRAQQPKLADALFYAIPSGVGSTGAIRLTRPETDRMLTEGARWAVQRGYGLRADLERIEHQGAMAGALPEQISEQARKRQRDEMGTLGSGNHYLEVQEVIEVFDAATAAAFGLRVGEVVVSIHCGSRGLGHQVATEFARLMLKAAQAHGITLSDPELACAPIRSREGEAYLGAMRAAANCALANRQIIAHLARETFGRVFGKLELPLLYDVSHNICQEEEHRVGDQVKQLFVHRKGATRALGSGQASPARPPASAVPKALRAGNATHSVAGGLPPEFQATGQPVLIGGSMGTASYVLAGINTNEERSFGSACHGAGRQMSRSQAAKQWQGHDVIKRLALRNILIRSASTRGVAEEAPGAYKDVSAVVEVTERAGLARKVAKLAPLICIKG